MLKKLIYTTIFSSSLLIYGVAMADTVPVVNAYQYESGDNSNATTDNQNTNYVQAPEPYLSTSQRLSRLEQQMSNQQLMDIPGQIQTLQRQIEKLQGQLQVQNHEIAVFKKELANAKPIAVASTSQAGADNTQTIVDTDASTTPATNSNFLNEQSTYQAAYNLIAAGKYPDAINAMNAYLQKFPNGQYASNAYYWLGELYLLQNNDAAATTNFQTVLSQYPNSSKYPDSMLKLGLIYYDNGQLIKAKVQLQNVVKLYPNTTVANLASARLLDINQQTNTAATTATQPVASQDTASITTTSSSN